MDSELLPSALVPGDQAGQALNSTSFQGALSASPMPLPGYFHTPFRESLEQKREMIERSGPLRHQH